LHRRRLLDLWRDGADFIAKLHEPFPVWTGALAGLLSSILMGLLMITYRMPKE